MVDALVLGVYNTADKKQVFTEAAAKFDQDVKGKLRDLVDKFGPKKKGNVKVFYDLHPDFPVVGVAGLGPTDVKYNEQDEIHESRENVRVAMGLGAKAVRSDEVGAIYFDCCNDAEASAEGATLALWKYDELKSEKHKSKLPRIECHKPPNDDSIQGFNRGRTIAQAQNICRRLAETPANLMTPTIFCENVVEMMKPFPKVSVKVHDKAWAESKKMGAFLSVAKGSDEPLKFLEIHYNNKESSKPVVFVGKGICFDSGGISLKPPANMDQMRADMMGAANVVSTIFALATLKTKANVVGLTPLCENLPSGRANKPGDVVVAMNGKSIQVDNTDAEGRLILADALCYAHEFWPQGILDIATLTGAMVISLGSSATGVFSNSKEFFELLRVAGQHTGDRVWRMPLWSHFKPQVTDSQLADCLNIGKNGSAGGSCTAAAFLSEFVECNRWMHLDIAGVMSCSDTDLPYLSKGMSGRPVRTLVNFFESFFIHN